MLKFIKTTFFDIILLYKNFLNWNIKKFLIFFWSYILAFLLVLPFLGIYFLIAYLLGDSLDNIFNILLNNKFTGNIYLDLFFLFIIFLFIIFNFYKYFLISKVNLDYLDGEKKHLKDNYYFNFKKFKKYFLLTLTNILFFFLLMIIFLIIFLILYYIFGGLENIQSIISSGALNIVSILSILLSFFGVVLFFYLFYRLIFSYYILLDDKENEIKNFKYIKISLKITKSFKNFFKFLILNIIFVILLIPSYILLSFYNNNINNLSNYITYEYGIEDEQKAEIFDPYIESLKLEFSKLSYIQLENLIKKYNINIIIINIINFILLSGLYSMVLTSFYKRELLKNKN